MVIVVAIKVNVYFQCKLSNTGNMLAGIILLEQHIACMLQDCQQNILSNSAVQGFLNKHERLVKVVNYGIPRHDIRSRSCFEIKYTLEDVAP